MNTTTVLQVRLPMDLRIRSEERANELGFASIQEAVRVFLSSFSLGKIRPGIVSDTTYSEEGEHIVLSEAAKHRIAEMRKDFRVSRNVRKLTDPNKAFAWLKG